VQELQEIDPGTELDARKVHSLYTASIYKIAAEGLQSGNQTCIVCNGQHRFDGCDVLKNTKFLQGHYIRYCQQLRREASARDAALNGNAASTPSHQRHPVNFLDSHSDEPESEPATAPDFQTGRR
jgi:hypothetical protein